MKQYTRRLGISTALAVFACTACASDAEQPRSHARMHSRDARTTPEPIEPGVERPTFCYRPADDQVRDVFCADTLPVVESLTDLQDLLDANPVKTGFEGLYPDEVPPENPFAINRGVAVTAHSTALSGHLVSPINPRAIIAGTSVLFTFQRGIQRVEIVANDRETNSFNFYLFTFKQACNAEKRGCSPGDLYTPQIERDWLSVSVRDGEELKNTPSDCRQCHQRAREEPTLLMRELESPWTHFMFPVGIGSPIPGVTSSHLMQDYVDAKGDEPYAGFAVDTLSPLSAFTLQTMVARRQPLLFDAPTIENERHPYGPDGYAVDVHPSPTWDAGYEAFKRGEQLALPYIEQRATDPQKQADLTLAYQRYRAGELSADELPDLGDIFPDDPYVRAKIGLQTEPDAEPVDALIQACGSCHNDVLDQTISRARFNVNLARLDRSELAVAIDRLGLPRTAAGAMPPPEARQLDSDVRERLVKYLKRKERPEEDDARLAHAAAMGMSGGAGPDRR